MVTIELYNEDQKTVLKVYNSVKELPIELSKKMQSYLLQESGVGSTVQDVDGHLARLTTFLAKDMKAEAIEETQNLRLALFSGVMEMRFDSPAFGCLVYSVDGKRVEDYSATGLQELMAMLSEKGLTNEKMEEVLSDVKKNLIPNGNFISLPFLATT